MATTQYSTATNITGPVTVVPAPVTQTGPNAPLNVQTAAKPKYFNNLMSVPFNVAAETNDAIVAFFEEYCNNKITAQNLAATLTYSAKAQNLNPLQILGQFQSLPKGELSNYLIAFLNSNRVPTSVLGVKKGTKTSPYVTRTILL